MVKRLTKLAVPCLILLVVFTAIVALAPIPQIKAQVNAFFAAVPQATSATSFKMTESGYGAKHIIGTNTELITLSTSSANSDSVANLLPANSIIESVTGVVTTAITGTCTGWTLADVTTAGRFAASNTTLTAGASSIGLVHWSGAITTLAAGPSQAADAKIRIVCATGAATTGAIRVTVTYHTIAPDYL